MKILTNKKLDTFILEAELRWGKNPEYYPFIIIGKNYKIKANITFKDIDISYDEKDIMEIANYKNLRIYQVLNEQILPKNDIYQGFAPFNPNKNSGECFGAPIPCFSMLKLN